MKKSAQKHMPMIENKYVVPSASEVDYTDVESIYGYQILACKIFEREGGFNLPSITNATIRQVQKQGLSWLSEVRRTVKEILSDHNPTKLTLAAIPQLLSSYDFFYRVCNGETCFDYLRDVKLKTVGKWLKGDKSISMTDLALMLLEETDRDIKSLESRFAKFAIDTLSSWVDEQEKYGRFIDTTFSEDYKRLKYLISTDLFAFFGSKDAPKKKGEWVKKYTQTEDKINALDTNDLLSYLDFVNDVSNLSRPTSEEMDERYLYSLSKIYARNDINPFYRKAIEIDLDRFKKHE